MSHMIALLVATLAILAVWYLNALLRVTEPGEARRVKKLFLQRIPVCLLEHTPLSKVSSVEDAMDVLRAEPTHLLRSPHSPA